MKLPILIAAAFSLIALTNCKHRGSDSGSANCPPATGTSVGGTANSNGSGTQSNGTGGGSANATGTAKADGKHHSGKKLDPEAGKVDAADPSNTTAGSRTTGTHSGTGGDGTNGTRPTPSNTGTYDKTKVKP